MPNSIHVLNVWSSIVRVQHTPKKHISKSFIRIIALVETILVGDHLFLLFFADYQCLVQRSETSLILHSAEFWYAIERQPFHTCVTITSNFLSSPLQGLWRFFHVGVSTAFKFSIHTVLTLHY